jgi:hypothetical protein
MENVNDIFTEFAACFAGTLEGDGEIAHPERLDRSKLDCSVPSLKVVDNYLTYLHENRPEQMGREWVKAVLWGGAYVGEVIRRNASREYNWVDFDEFVREYPDTTRLLGEEKQLGFCALLTAGGAGSRSRSTRCSGSSTTGRRTACTSTRHARSGSASRV